MYALFLFVLDTTQDNKHTEHMNKQQEKVMKYIIWQRLPKTMLCGYRDTKEEAEECIKELTSKNINAIFYIRCVNKQGGAQR